jgi:hypothetical protein
MWCLLFALPYAWCALPDAALQELAYALHACDDAPVVTHRAWLAMRAHQACADGLGALVAVRAWDAEDSARVCADLLVRARPDLPVQIACSAATPVSSWWNHTCMNDARWEPPPVAAAPSALARFLDDAGLRGPVGALTPALAHTSVALALLLLALWLLAWVPFARASHAAPPTTFVVRSAPPEDDSALEMHKLVRQAASDDDIDAL